MEHLCLIESIDYRKIRVVNIKRCEILNNISKANQMVGMW